MKPAKIIILTVLLATCMAATSEAGWLIYYKPEYQGKVIDSETKQPIEGAVVVAVYNKTTMGLGAGTLSSIINVQEALTDKNGLFRIPSYTTIIQPFSWEASATFIVFKPGYAAVSGLDLEETLSKETAQEVELPWLYNKEMKFRFASRLVGLPKLKTREEKHYNMPSPVGEDSDYRKQKQFIQLLNEENRNLGIKGQYQIK